MTRKEKKLEKKASSANFAGILNIKLIEGKELPARDLNGLSDPYVVMYVSSDKKKKVKSSTHMKTLSPVWNENLNLNVAHDEDTLEVTVYDFDRVSKDDIIGETSIPLKDIPNNGDAKDGWYNLRNPEGAGKIHLIISYTSLQWQNKKIATAVWFPDSN